MCLCDRMIEWIKQGLEKVVPQPEIHVHPKTEVTEKTEAPASTKGTFSFNSSLLGPDRYIGLPILWVDIGLLQMYLYQCKCSPASADIKNVS